jgi:hypothetical protein
MTPDNNTASRSVADPRIIAAPQASDALAGVFRTAFGATADLPDDFRAILARLDRDERAKH